MKIRSVATIDSLTAVAWYDPQYQWVAAVEDKAGNLLTLSNGTTADYLGGVGQSAACRHARALLIEMTPDAKCANCGDRNALHGTGTFRACEVGGCQCLNFKARKG